MKTLLRNILLNAGVLWLTTQLLPSFNISGGFQGLLIGASAFMLASIILVPLLRILLLPLNLLTVGIFAWLSNVIALYILVTMVPYFVLNEYFFTGTQINGFIIPPMILSKFQVAAVASLIIGLITHFVKWLIK